MTIDPNRNTRRNVSLPTFVNRPNFLVGWVSAMTDRPFDYDMNSVPYEIGRLAAKTYKNANGNRSAAFSPDLALKWLAIAYNTSAAPNNRVGGFVDPYLVMAATLPANKQFKPTVNLSNLL